MEVLAGAASVIAVIQLAQTIGGALKTYYQGVKDSRKDIERLFCEVGSLEAVLKEIKDRKDLTISATLKSNTGPLQQCYIELSDLSGKIQATSAKKISKTLQLRWPFKKEDVSKIVLSLERQKSTLTLLINIENLTINVTQNSILEAIQADIIAARENATRQRIMGWLATVDPSWEHNIARGKHKGSTGSWLLESHNFQEWMVSENSFLWMHGNAGSGKSILCSTVIDHVRNQCLKDPTSAIAYWYFTFTNTQKQSVSNFLRSIIVQLCGQRRDTPDELQASFTSHAYGTHQPGQKELMKMLSTVIYGFDHVFLVVDALDECPKLSGERAELLELLYELAGSNLEPLHFLVTSRKEGDIEEVLKDAMEGANSQPPINIQGIPVQNDIKAFITERLRERAFQRWSAERKGHVTNELSQQAHGMFRLVALQLDVLSRGVTPDQIEDTLKSLPRTLDAFYDKVLLEIDPIHQRHALAALQWLAFSARPLRLDELAEAIVIQADKTPALDALIRLWNDSEILKILSAGLITISYDESEDLTVDEDSSAPFPLESLKISGEMGTESKHLDSSAIKALRDPTIDNVRDQDLLLRRPARVRFAHFSVKEYLVSDRTKTGKAQIYHVNEILAHKAIVQACFAYVSDAGKISSSIEQKLKDFPLLGYACRCWPSHIQHLAQDWAQFPSHEVLQFLNAKSKGFQVWADLTALTDKDLGLSGTRGFLFRCKNPDELISEPYSLWDFKLAQPIFYVSWFGMSQVLRLMLEQDPRLLNPGGLKWIYGEPLHAAAAAGHQATVEVLLKAGAKVNAVSVFCSAGLQVNQCCHMTPLMLAAHGGHVTVAKGLLAAGADIHCYCKHHNSTALKVAIQGAFEGLDRLPVIELLLEHGALSDEIDYHSRIHVLRYIALNSPLKHIVPIMEPLFKHGPIPEAQIADGSGVFLDIISSRGTSFEREEVAINSFEGVLDWLVDRGLRINDIAPILDSKDHKNVYYTALQYAANRFFPRVVDMLMRKGARINTGTGTYGSALQAAIAEVYTPQNKTPCIKVVQLLLEYGAGINAQGGKYGTAIQAAVSNGHLEALNILLSWGANIEDQAKSKMLRTQCKRARLRPIVEGNKDTNDRGHEGEGKEMELCQPWSPTMERMRERMK